jgi:hypothetical protein
MLLKLLFVTENNTTITEMIDRIANVYHYKPVEGK